MKKKGIFFTVDALLASTLILFGLIVVSVLYSTIVPTKNIEYLSNDFVVTMSNTRVSDFNSSYLKSLIASGYVKNSSINGSVLELVGELWTSGNKAVAENLAKELINLSLKDDLGIVGAGIYLNNELIYEYNSALSLERKYLTTSFGLISGIEEAKPKEGYSSRALLSAINSKSVFSYAYFGGLVGQGNITQFFSLPQNYSAITEAYLEVDSDSNFSLSINGHYAGTYPSGCSGGGFMRPYKCYINSSYFSFFSPGFNRAKFSFNNLSTAYLSSGFIRVKTTTIDLNYSDVSYDSSTNIASRTEYFPGVDYVINIYSSFYVPGSLNNMEIFLNYTTELPLFMNIGGTVVYYSENQGNVVATLDNSTLSSLLNYSFLSDKTIPIKIGHYALNETDNVTGGNADIILITDLSGSMKWRIGDDTELPGNVRTCDNPDLYHKDDTRRVSLAKCLDKEFIDIVMNFSGNRIWLVDFTDLANYYYSSSATALKNYVENNYPNNPSGGTCICCAINMAYNLLNQYSNSSRKKYVMVMSDGIPTYCCGRYYSAGWKCNITGISTSNKYNPWACGGGSDDCSTNDCEGPVNSSINAAARVHNNLNATIYSIGFGPMVNCTTANTTMQQIAIKGNGTYHGSRNATELLDFYRQIAGEIVNKSLVYQYQMVIVSGINSTLYPNSYLKITYTPTTPPFIFGKIPVTAESNTFGNYLARGTFNIPDSAIVSEAKVTSYSSYYWTHNMTVNGVQAFNLSSFGSQYTALGDPFLVNIPVDMLTAGDNTVVVSTGISPTSDSGGSPDDRIIYTMLINSSISYSTIESTANGCTWFLEFNDGTNTTIKVPAEYSGTDVCNFRTASFDSDDAIDVAVYNILKQLDLDKDGVLDININQQSLSIQTVLISRVPSMWGPAMIEARVWK